jgi:putative FmdB family regulatory protein
MPLFEYECKQCGTVFEVLQKSSEPALTIHAQCGGQLEKLISPSAFHFKGSGWYATDYAKNSYKAAAKDDKPAAPEVKKETPKPAADTK